MDIDLLKTFLEVYRTRHFGQAAENLFVSQSAVSARIRLLEQTIGSAVFTRERNNIQLTPVGQKLLRHAEAVVTAWNRARQELATAEDTITLSIGGVPSLWDIRLQSWIYALRHAYPRLSLSAELLSADVIVRRLLDGTLDLGFTFEAVQAAALEAREILSVALIMVSSRPGLCAERATQSDYILVDWGTLFSIAHARHFPEMPPPQLRVGLGRLARDLLLEHGGSAYLAEPMVARQLEDGRLYRVEGAPVIERSAYALYPAGGEKHELTEKGLALIGLSQT